MTNRSLNVALIGTKFMGKAHSHAWSSAGKFFELPAEPVLAVAVGRDKPSLDEFAGRWGWRETATDWRDVIRRPDIDIVDTTNGTVERFKNRLARRYAVACENLQLALIAQNIVHPATHDKAIGTESTDDRIDPIVESDLIVGT